MGRIAYYLLDGGRGILHEARGYVPGRFFVDAWEGFMACHAERVRSVDYWLSDYEGSDPRDIRSPDVERVVDLTAGAFHPGQVIGTHAPGHVEFGMTRMWHLRSEYNDPDWRVTVSRDRGALLEWIGEQLGAPIGAVRGELLFESVREGDAPGA
jgi:hypothetical protein